MDVRSSEARDTRGAGRLPADAHKGTAGRCLCVVGSRLMPGAALLVARAAQRAGAGLVTVACVDEALATTVPIGAPEAVLADLWSGSVAASGAAALERAVEGAHALVIGPGLGRGERTRRLTEASLAVAPGMPRVFDADALSAFTGRPEALRAAAGPLVLTPHPGEAERLLGAPVPRDAAGRASFARRIAERTGALVVLKGRGSVIASERDSAVNATGNEGMATAGAGDVLAGMLVAYLARAAANGDALVDEDVFACTARAVRLHGRAGDLAAARVGKRALIASDLIEALPQAQLEWEGE